MKSIPFAWFCLVLLRLSPRDLAWPQRPRERERAPPGWDAVEAPACNSGAQVLAAVLATIKGLAGRVDAAQPRLDGILPLKGVIEVV